MKSNPLPSLERLNEILKYDPETGIIYWRQPAPKRRLSIPAGYKAPNGYIQIRIDGILCKAHRLAYYMATGKMPVEPIDHINGDRSDNRSCNLRETTQFGNLQNMKTPTRNTSGIKGVSRDNRRGGWRAQLMANRKSLYLGAFKTKEAAQTAVENARKTHHGEFARHS